MKMKSPKEQMNEIEPPMPREVWTVLDEKVSKQENSGKKYRFALILCAEESIIDGYSIINIIPLSVSKKVDSHTFPMNRAYESTVKKFEPHIDSKAVIRLFQPIKLEYFNKKHGTIDQNSYQAIKHILCTEIIEYIPYSFDG